MTDFGNIKTFKDAISYLLSQTDDMDFTIFCMCIAFAALITYLVFYTDTPEAAVGAVTPMGSEGGGGGGGVLATIIGALAR